jgi:hypothetical protein
VSLDSRSYQVFSFKLLANSFNLLDHRSFRFLIQTVLTALSAFYMTLHILNM